MSKRLNYTYLKEAQRVGRRLSRFGASDMTLENPDTQVTPDIQVTTDTQVTSSSTPNTKPKDQMLIHSCVFLSHLWILIAPSLVGAGLAIMKLKEKDFPIEPRYIALFWIVGLSSSFLLCFCGLAKYTQFRLFGPILLFDSLSIYTVVDFFPSMIFRWLLIVSIMTTIHYIVLFKYYRSIFY
jgi:hypothetical protein